MANAAVYVVRSTQVPGVPFEVSRAEYEYLVELNILEALDEVIIPADQVVISPTAPTAPDIGTVWFNTSA